MRASGLAAALALGVGAIVVASESPPPAPVASEACSEPVVVDDLLHCGGLTTQQLLGLCPRSSKPSSTDAPRGGDALRMQAYCRPGHAVRLSGRRGWSRMSPAELQDLGVAIDLNEASPEELTSLHGVGPVVASRIDAARPFESVDELLEVRGIGPVTLRRNRARLRINPP